MPSSRPQPKSQPQPQLLFETLTDCWINGRFYPAGEAVTLTAQDAKYLLLTGAIAAAEDDI